MPVSSKVHFVMQHHGFPLVVPFEHSATHFSLSSFLKIRGTEQHSSSLNFDTFGGFSQFVSVNDAAIKSSDEQSYARKVIYEIYWLTFATIILRIAMKYMRSQWVLQEDIDRLNSWLNIK